jgi:hypothetical protein
MSLAARARCAPEEATWTSRASRPFWSAYPTFNQFTRLKDDLETAKMMTEMVQTRETLKNYYLENLIKSTGSLTQPSICRLI